MTILRTLAAAFQGLFPPTRAGQERGRWLRLTLPSILIPVTVSRTSNLRRAIETLFGVRIAEWRYYRIMASPKLPWAGLWQTLWRAIPEPLVTGRLVLALDDSINPKTGQHIFAGQTTFDHAAKPNQTRWPWAQTRVTLGLLHPIHGRWCCLPLAFEFDLRRQTLDQGGWRLRGQPVTFADKFAQAVKMIRRVAAGFAGVPVLVVTDSWFGNNGLFKPLRLALGGRVHLLSRLRVNAALFAQPTPCPGQAGRPRKYGDPLGAAATLAARLRDQAQTYACRSTVPCARCLPPIRW